jgi:hypothetical protein
MSGTPQTPEPEAPRAGIRSVIAILLAISAAIAIPMWVVPWYMGEPLPQPLPEPTPAERAMWCQDNGYELAIDKSKEPKLIHECGQLKYGSNAAVYHTGAAGYCVIKRSASWVEGLGLKLRPHDDIRIVHRVERCFREETAAREHCAAMVTPSKLENSHE